MFLFLVFLVKKLFVGAVDSVTVFSVKEIIDEMKSLFHVLPWQINDGARGEDASNDNDEKKLLTMSISLGTRVPTYPIDIGVCYLFCFAASAAVVAVVDVVDVVAAVAVNARSELMIASYQFRDRVISCCCRCWSWWRNLGAAGNSPASVETSLLLLLLLLLRA